jgi:Flp pilus assembly protein TadB
MEKGNIVRILPKKNPWQLQRYAVSSFKFQDSDKSLVTLATDQQIKQMKDLLHSVVTDQEKGNRGKIEAFTLAFIAVVSYAILLAALLQSTINPIVFVSGLAISILCSLMLGKALGQRW